MDFTRPRMPASDFKNIMQAIKVIIDNWPSTSFPIEWTPIIISISALIATFYSLFITNKSFRRSVRPFVSAANVLDPDTKIDNPKAIIFTVTNAPAKITKCNLKIVSEKIVLMKKDCGANTIEYPEKIWFHSLSEEEFQKIIKNPNLIRVVLITYYSIDDKKKEYNFELIQDYDEVNKKWNNRNVVAS